MRPLINSYNDLLLEVERVCLASSPVMGMEANVTKQSSGVKQDAQRFFSFRPLCSRMPEELKPIIRVFDIVPSNLACTIHIRLSATYRLKSGPQGQLKARWRRVRGGDFLEWPWIGQGITRELNDAPLPSVQPLVSLARAPR